MRGSSGSRGRHAARDQGFQDRLEAYARYAALVRGQEEALENDDLERFREMAEAREEIQRELGAGPHQFPEEGELDPENLELLRRVHADLRDAQSRDLRLRARLRDLRKSTSGEVRTVADRGGQIRQYLVGDNNPEDDSPARLNIRL